MKENIRHHYNNTYRDVIHSRTRYNSNIYQLYREVYGLDYMMQIMNDSPLIYNIAYKGKNFIKEALLFVIMLRVDMINTLEHYNVTEPTYREIKSLRKEQLKDILICDDEDELIIDLHKSIMYLSEKFSAYAACDSKMHISFEVVLKRLYIHTYLIEKTYLKLISL